MSQDWKDNHLLYNRVEAPMKPDGIAWVFKNPKEFVEYPFKFPPMGGQDVRIKILYTGLCHSDNMGGRGEWGPRYFPMCCGHEIVGEI